MVVESLEPLPGPSVFFVGFASERRDSFRDYWATGMVRAALPCCTEYPPLSISMQTC